MKFNKRFKEELNKQFPKGDKARKRALTLYTIGQLEIALTEVRIERELFEEIKDRIKEELKEKIRNSKDDWITTLRRELKEEMINNL